MATCGIYYYYVLLTLDEWGLHWCPHTVSCTIFFKIVFRLLTLCAKMLMSIGNPLLH